MLHIYQLKNKIVIHNRINIEIIHYDPAFWNFKMTTKLKTFFLIHVFILIFSFVKVLYGIYVGKNCSTTLSKKNAEVRY